MDIWGWYRFHKGINYFRRLSLRGRRTRFPSNFDINYINGHGIWTNLLGDECPRISNELKHAYAICLHSKVTESLQTESLFCVDSLGLTEVMNLACHYAPKLRWNLLEIETPWNWRSEAYSGVNSQAPRLSPGILCFFLHELSFWFQQNHFSLTHSVDCCYTRNKKKLNEITASCKKVV